MDRKTSKLEQDMTFWEILRFVYENENGVSENKLKDYIESTGSKNVNQIYIHLTRKNKDYSLIFERTENETNLKKEAREHIDNL